MLRSSIRIGFALTFAGAGFAQHAERLAPKDAEQLRALQPKIDAAIDEGVAWILSTQQRDGSWQFEREVFPTGQTALCAYTLLKCGLPPAHAAVRRAIANMKSVAPTMVYSAGCQMLALAATYDPSHHEHMRRIVRSLERWQDGTWGYPNPRGEITRLHSDRDLSITQFALLAFRAAQQSGLDVSRRSLQEAFDDLLRYQANGAEAGFRYLWSQRQASTGSMTTAGIAALELAADCLGDDLGRSRRRQLDDATTRGLAWLDRNWSVETNPGSGSNWLYYYLYGLERVGSLTGTEYVGEHAWYLEGARFLVQKQNGGGDWRQRDSEPDTCFALLFLKRATAPTTGKAARPSRVAENGAESEVGLSVRADPDGSTVHMWVHRLAGLAAAATPAAWPLVSKVDYSIDGDVVATVELGGPWRASPCMARHTLRERGAHRFSAKVHTYELDGDEKKPAKVYEAKPVELTLDHVLESWMLDAAVARTRNLLLDARPRAIASSTHANNGAERATDGEECTAWLFARDDAEPVLDIRLARSVRAGVIRLTQVDGQLSQRDHHDRIERVEITLDRGAPMQVDLARDGLAPTRVALPASARIRRIQIRVSSRARGVRHAGIGGFAEVGLERR